PPAFAPVDAELGVGLPALHPDVGDPAKGLDIADQRRLVVQTICLQLGREVARLGAPVVDGLDQRALLAADVTAGADEDRYRKASAQHRRGWTADAQSLCAEDLFFASGDLLGVLVADVNETLCGLGDQTGENDAFDDQV